jgi:peptidoglycan hydrolase-like protein with peptidoglycan-binding domain
VSLTLAAPASAEAVFEFWVPQSNGRADVAVIGTTMDGFEIKTERDSLRRLPRQADAYSRVFDHCHAVLAHRHVDRAQAHHIGYVDWRQHDTLCDSGSCNTSGNQVGVWQTILHDDHSITGKDKCATSGGVDGYFGSTIKTDTKAWQNWLGLSNDGIVGRQHVGQGA